MGVVSMFNQFKGYHAIVRLDDLEDEINKEQISKLEAVGVKIHPMRIEEIASMFAVLSQKQFDTEQIWPKGTVYLLPSDNLLGIK